MDNPRRDSEGRALSSPGTPSAGGGAVVTRRWRPPLPANDNRVTALQVLLLRLVWIGLAALAAAILGLGLN